MPDKSNELCTLLDSESPYSIHIQMFIPPEKSPWTHQKKCFISFWTSDKLDSQKKRYKISDPMVEGKNFQLPIYLTDKTPSPFFL